MRFAAGHRPACPSAPASDRAVDRCASDWARDHGLRCTLIAKLGPWPGQTTVIRMEGFIVLIRAAFASLCLAVAWPGESSAEPVDPTLVETEQAAPALDTAVQALCERKLVLLGENGFHGEGRTSAFKSELVRRLVSGCGFDAVVFESSLYDFRAFGRAVRRGTASPSMLPSAVGGLWNSNPEVRTLLDFLFEETQAGRVALAGMDDQLGSRGAFYSLEAMPAELAGLLSEPRSGECAVRLKQRIWSRYSAADPYDEVDREAVMGCLIEIDRALDAADFPGVHDRADLRAMIAGFRSAVGRDFLDQSRSVQARDRDMAGNLAAIISSLPAEAKVIVWSANLHVAKDVSFTTTFGDHPNMGVLLARRYGDAAYSVGFSAAGGSYRHVSGEIRAITPAAVDTLEARALSTSGAETVWLDGRDLERLAPSPGLAFLYEPMEANWPRLFDAMVIIRTERPAPTSEQ